jgi:hypothetical protein
MEQRFPIRFGPKSLYLATYGSGPVTGVRINGNEWDVFDTDSIRLPYEATPEDAHIQIALGGADLDEAPAFRVEPSTTRAPEDGHLARLGRFHTGLVSDGLDGSYEARHAALAFEAYSALRRRRALLARGTLKPLPEPSGAAADECYANTVTKLAEGLKKTVESYADSSDSHRKRVYRIWEDTEKP